MKRALLILALLVAPVLLHAQSPDRAILLAPNGTVYTVDSTLNEGAGSITSSRYLTLTIQNGTSILKTNVPASLTGGNNWQPELAFDSDSDTLFVFWLHSQNTILGANELLFSSYQNGKWNAPSSIDDVPYHFRYNLRVGMTRSVQAQDDGGGARQVPGLTVHVAWWDESSVGEVCRYAMLTVEKGVVTAVYRRDLPDFINNAYMRSFELGNDDRELLRHPIVFESPDHDTVDIVFGDMQTNTIHRLTLKPVLDSRVRIPIGVRDGGFPAPHHKLTSDAKLSAIATPYDRLVFYYIANGAVKYLQFEDGSWQREKTITLTDAVSAEAAVSALRRMVRGD